MRYQVASALLAVFLTLASPQKTDLPQAGEFSTALRNVNENPVPYFTIDTSRSSSWDICQPVPQDITKNVELKKKYLQLKSVYSEYFSSLSCQTFRDVITDPTIDEAGYFFDECGKYAFPKNGRCYDCGRGFFIRRTNATYGECVACPYSCTNCYELNLCNANSCPSQYLFSSKSNKCEVCRENKIISFSDNISCIDLSTCTIVIDTSLGAHPNYQSENFCRSTATNRYIKYYVDSNTISPVEYGTYANPFRDIRSVFNELFNFYQNTTLSSSSGSVDIYLVKNSCWEIQEDQMQILAKLKLSFLVQVVSNKEPDNNPIIVVQAQGKTDGDYSCEKLQPSAQTVKATRSFAAKDVGIPTATVMWNVTQRWQVGFERLMTSKFGFTDDATLKSLMNSRKGIFSFINNDYFKIQSVSFYREPSILSVDRPMFETLSVPTSDFSFELSNSLLQVANKFFIARQTASHTVKLIGNTIDVTSTMQLIGFEDPKTSACGQLTVQNDIYCQLALNFFQGQISPDNKLDLFSFANSVSKLSFQGNRFEKSFKWVRNKMAETPFEPRFLNFTQTCLNSTIQILENNFQSVNGLPNFNILQMTPKKKSTIQINSNEYFDSNFTGSHIKVLSIVDTDIIEINYAKFQNNTVAISPQFYNTYLYEVISQGSVAIQQLEWTVTPIRQFLKVTSSKVEVFKLTISLPTNSSLRNDTVSSPPFLFASSRESAFFTLTWLNLDGLIQNCCKATKTSSFIKIYGFSQVKILQFYYHDSFQQTPSLFQLNNVQVVEIEEFNVTNIVALTSKGDPVSLSSDPAHQLFELNEVHLKSGSPPSFDIDNLHMANCFGMTLLSIDTILVSNMTQKNPLQPLTLLDIHFETEKNKPYLITNNTFHSSLFRTKTSLKYPLIEVELVNLKLLGNKKIPALDVSLFSFDQGFQIATFIDANFTQNNLTLINASRFTGIYLNSSVYFVQNLIYDNFLIRMGPKSALTATGSNFLFYQNINLFSFEDSAGDFLGTNSTFKRNLATLQLAGGVFTMEEQAEITVTSSTFDHNFSIFGASIASLLYRSSLTIARSQIFDSCIHQTVSWEQSLSDKSTNTMGNEFCKTFLLLSGSKLSIQEKTNVNLYYYELVKSLQPTFQTAQAAAVTLVGNLLNLNKLVNYTKIDYGSLQQSDQTKFYPVEIQSSQLILDNISVNTELDFFSMAVKSTFKITGSQFCIYSRPVQQITYALSSILDIQTSTFRSQSGGQCPLPMRDFIKARLMPIVFPPTDNSLSRSTMVLSDIDVEMFYLSSESVLSLAECKFEEFKQRFLHLLDSSATLNVVTLQNLKIALQPASAQAMITVTRSSLHLMECVIQEVGVFTIPASEELSFLRNLIQVPVIEAYQMIAFVMENSQVSNLESQFMRSQKGDQILINGSTFKNIQVDRNLVKGAVFELFDQDISIVSSTFKTIVNAIRGGAIYSSSPQQTRRVWVNITDSTFSNIQSDIEGGVGYLYNVNLNTKKSTFANNRALNKTSKGGVFFLECDYLELFALIPTTRCDYLYETTTFESNSAIQAGGVFQYNSYKPTQVGNKNVLKDNSATYGTNFASYPVKMVLQAEIDGQAKDVDFIEMKEYIRLGKSYMDGYFEVPSGLLIENPLLLTLKDELDVIVRSEASSLCSVTIDPPSTVSKNTKVKASDGTYVFDDFIVTSSPNSLVNITFTSDAINSFLVEIYNKGTLSNDSDVALTNQPQKYGVVTVTMSVRVCTRGEREINATTCSVCEVGTYSLAPNSNACKECIKHATCYGSYNISVDFGYWRENVNKEIVYQCYYMPACQGGYESTCQAGYAGRLCHDCEYYAPTETQFQRKGQHRCVACPKSGEKVAIILATVALSIVIVTTIYRAAVRVPFNRRYEMCLFRILIDFIHNIVIVRYFDLVFPEILENWLDIFSILGVYNEHIFSIDCYFRSNASLSQKSNSVIIFKGLLALFGPVVLFLFFQVFWRCYCFKDKQNYEQQVQKATQAEQEKLEQMQLELNRDPLDEKPADDKPKNTQSKLLHSQMIRRNIYLSTGMIFYICFPLIVMKAFSLYPCIEFEPNQFFLFEDMETECYTTIHIVVMVCLGVPTIAVWVIAVPIYLFVKLFQNRKALNAEQNQEFYGFLYDGLKPQFFYFEFLLLIKKVILILCFKFTMNYFAMYKTLIALCLNIVQTEYQKIYKVYREDHLNLIHTTSNQCIQLICMISILFATTDPAMGGDDGNTKGNFLRETFEKPLSLEKILACYLLILFCWAFILLWVREFLIVKKEFLLKYRLTPKIKKIILFITQRPFSLRLRPEESDSEEEKAEAGDKTDLQLALENQSSIQKRTTINNLEFDDLRMDPDEATFYAKRTLGEEIGEEMDLRGLQFQDFQRQQTQGEQMKFIQEAGLRAQQLATAESAQGMLNGNGDIDLRAYVYMLKQRGETDLLKRIIPNYDPSDPKNSIRRQLDNYFDNHPSVKRSNRERAERKSFSINSKKGTKTSEQVRSSFDKTSRNLEKKHKGALSPTAYVDYIERTEQLKEQFAASSGKKRAKGKDDDESSDNSHCIFGSSESEESKTPAGLQRQRTVQEESDSGSSQSSKTDSEQETSSDESSDIDDESFEDQESREIDFYNKPAISILSADKKGGSDSLSRSWTSNEEGKDNEKQPQMDQEDKLDRLASFGIPENAEDRKRFSTVTFRAEGRNQFQADLDKHLMGDQQPASQSPNHFVALQRRKSINPYHLRSDTLPKNQSSAQGQSEERRSSLRNAQGESPDKRKSTIETWNAKMLLQSQGQADQRPEQPRRVSKKFLKRVSFLDTEGQK